MAVRAALALLVAGCTFNPGGGEVAIDWDDSVTFNAFGGAAGVQAGDTHPEVVDAIPTAKGTHDLDVTASLQRWSDPTRPNRGWILSSGSDNDQKIRSSEDALEAERPTLTVEFAVP